jgi:hypothetical protein
MPKPTFMQSVLRKPTRSYADPYGASPYADTYDTREDEVYERPSRYQPVIDRGAHLGYRERDRDVERPRPTTRVRDGYQEAGPSKPRRTTSVINDYPTRPSSSMSTRFPKPARKMHSTIELRETVIIHHRPQDTERVARGGTVKKKKPRARELDERSEMSSSPGMPVASASELRRMKKSVMADDDSSLASGPSSLPPSIRMRGIDSESSSARSSPVPPMSPVVPETASHLPRTMGKSKRRPSASVIQQAVITSNIAPLTPPESESSLHIADAVAQMNLRTKPISPPMVSSSLAPRPPRSPRRAGSDSEEEAFYTPRQSLEPPPRVPEIQIAPADEVKTLRPLAPMLSLQPPTPAAREDMQHSPLEEAADSPTRGIVSSPVNLAPAIDSPPLDQAETHSLHGAVGSDESDGEEEQEQPYSRPGSQRGHWEPQGATRSQPHSRQSSFNLAARPASRTGSMVVLPAHRAPSSGGSMGPPPMPIKAKTMGPPSSVGQSSARSGRPVSKSVFSDFKVLRRGSGAASERSYGASDVTPNSGYGKGGWAAAHGNRSNAPSPVMYMPQGANDGWAEFQPPKSKFTPLPQASQGPTFENMLQEEQRDLDHLGVDEEYSSPSEYSKLSDGPPGPQPSRSYAKASHSSHSQDLGSDDEASPSALHEQPSVGRSSSDEQYHPYRDRSDTIRGPPQPRPTRGFDSRPPSAMERYSRSPSSGNAGGSRVAHSRSPSHVSSSTSPSPLSRPISPQPQPPRPSSSMSMMSSTPRGFDAPSFLNPDTLTFLPEMTVEDSGRTYIPDPAGDAQRKADAIRRIRSSIYSKSIKSARSVKSAGSDEEGDAPQRPPSRAKSAIGFRRGSTRKWEGSTAGEGVLLESNGLDQTHNGGYTTLILPTGAYTPQSPSKAATELNARVLGLPHAAMAALVLSSATHRLRSDTPAHLRNQLPAPVDFSSHLKPPTKVSDNQVLVQVYAVAIDGFDMAVLDVKGRADVGKWVPGRSFVGRCLQAGSYEKELVRGDLVMGICDIRKVCHLVHSHETMLTMTERCTGRIHHLRSTSTCANALSDSAHARTNVALAITRTGRHPRTTR